MITVGMAREFVRDYLGTLNCRDMRNTFRSVHEIARIMEVSLDDAIRYVVVARKNGFMCDDNRPLPSYMQSLTLYKVCENFK